MTHKSQIFSPAPALKRLFKTTGDNTQRQHKKTDSTEKQQPRKKHHSLARFML
jgi:hypothetical protein